MHIHGGNLLMTTGSHESAIKTFSSIYEKYKEPQALYQRAKCYVALSLLEEAFNDLSELIEKDLYKKLKKEEESMALADYMCLFAIHAVIKDHSLCQKGIEILNELMEDKEEKNSKNNPQLNYFKDWKLEGEYTHNEKYKDSIFERQDIYLYRGVLQFHQQNYLAALSDFNASYTTKQELETPCIDSRSQESKSHFNSIDTDLSDVGLCALNVNEYKFNAILCYILVYYF